MNGASSPTSRSWQGGRGWPEGRRSLPNAPHHGADFTFLQTSTETEIWRPLVLFGLLCRSRGSRCASSISTGSTTRASPPLCSGG
jgi:hypothetical protein